MPHRNERVELEMKILKYRQHSKLLGTDVATKQRIDQLIAELEQKLQEIDE
jgi:hypothetical protein